MPNYVNNKQLLEAIQESKKQGKINTYLAQSILLIAQRYGTRSQFRGYSYNDEMVGEAIVQMTTGWSNFNPDKSSNPMSYLTMIAHNAFLRILNLEKKQREIRDDILEMNDQAPSSTRMNENDPTKDTSIKLTNELRKKANVKVSTAPKSKMEQYYDLYTSGQSLQEIHNETGKKITAIRKAISRYCKKNKLTIPQGIEIIPIPKPIPIRSKSREWYERVINGEEIKVIAKENQLLPGQLKSRIKDHCKRNSLSYPFGTRDHRTAEETIELGKLVHEHLENGKSYSNIQILLNIRSRSSMYHAQRKYLEHIENG